MKGTEQKPNRMGVNKDIQRIYVEIAKHNKNKIVCFSFSLLLLLLYICMFLLMTCGGGHEQKVCLVSFFFFYRVRFKCVVLTRRTRVEATNEQRWRDYIHQMTFVVAAFVIFLLLWKRRSRHIFFFLSSLFLLLSCNKWTRIFHFFHHIIYNKMLIGGGVCCSSINMRHRTAHASHLISTRNLNITRESPTTFTYFYFCFFP